MTDEILKAILLRAICNSLEDGMKIILSEDGKPTICYRREGFESIKRLVKNSDSIIEAINKVESMAEEPVYGEVS